MENINQEQTEKKNKQEEKAQQIEFEKKEDIM